MRFSRVFILCFVFVCLCLTPDARAQKNVFKATVDSDGVQRVTVTGGSYFFNPDYIILKANVPVEMTVKREAGLTPHDIVIKGADAGIDITEELDTEPKVIKFTPKKTGKYPFYCSKKLLFFKSHRERGMEGVIEVVE
ncbi:MAG: cupredoxin domain-containing protein [Nitrospirota bacterium]